MESVRRLSASVARWTFSTPVFGVDDLAGLEIDGGGPSSISWHAGSPTIDATYSSAVIVGHDWVLDDGSILYEDALYFPGQSGTVV